MDKVTSRMNPWTARHFSFGGRLQLIESVIYILVNSWCQVFVLPKKKKVTKMIQSKCIASLWKVKLVWADEACSL